MELTILKMILGFILKNIAEKKFRAFLILLSIILSSALCFATLAFSSTIEKMYEDTLRSYYGNVEIIVHPNEKSPSNGVKSINALKHADHFEYVFGTSSIGGIYKIDHDTNISLNIRGLGQDEMTKVNPVLPVRLSDASFSGKRILIGKDLAAKLSLDIDDTIDIYVNGNRNKFNVSGIYNNQGLFKSDPNNNTFNIIAPTRTVQSLSGLYQADHALIIKTNNTITIDEGIELLEKEYTRYTVREPYDLDGLERMMNTITTPFMLMLILVLFISVFIIYSSFKVITSERLPVIGTLRSIGATKKKTDFLLFGESFFYGAFGGILGILLGFGILYIMAMNMSKDSWSDFSLNIVISFKAWHVLSGLLLGIVLSIISSIIPIIKTSKIPVKDIILNNIRTAVKKKRHIKNISGFIFIISGMVLPVFITRNMPVCALSMLLLLIGIIFLVPLINRILLLICEKFYTIIFGNEGLMAARNLRGNKNIINNITLLAIGISALLMINSTSKSVADEVLNAYSNAKFDISISTANTNRQQISRLKTIDGIEAINPVYQAFNVKTQYAGKNINYLVGIDPTKYFLYAWDENILGDKKHLLSTLGDSRHILLGYYMKDKFQLAEGDYIEITANNKPRKYMVTGFVDTLNMNGQIAFIHEKYFKYDFNRKYYSELLIKTNKSADSVLSEIKERFKNVLYYGITVSDMEKNNMDSNNQIFVMMQAFSVLTMLIGIVGIFNNFVVSLLQRKKHLAIMRSVGMSKRQTIKMLLVESISSGFTGSMIGILAGVLLCISMKNIFKAMDIPPMIHLYINMFINSVIIGIIVSILASLSPIIKSSKMNIITAVKYE
jgi:putative ABC transport system permease protein